MGVSDFAGADVKTRTFLLCPIPLRAYERHY